MNKLLLQPEKETYNKYTAYEKERMDGNYSHKFYDVCGMPFGIGKDKEDGGARNDQAGCYSLTGTAQADKF